MCLWTMDLLVNNGQHRVQGNTIDPEEGCCLLCYPWENPLGLWWASSALCGHHQQASEVLGINRQHRTTLDQHRTPVEGNTSQLEQQQSYLLTASDHGAITQDCMKPRTIHTTTTRRLACTSTAYILYDSIYYMLSRDIIPPVGVKVPAGGWCIIALEPRSV